MICKQCQPKLLERFLGIESYSKINLRCNPSKKYCKKESCPVYRYKVEKGFIKPFEEET